MNLIKPRNLLFSKENENESNEDIDSDKKEKYLL